MAKAIFTEEFNYSSRSSNAGWSVQPDPKPQSFPQELTDAAVAAGKATPVKPARKGTVPKEAKDG